MDGFIKVITMIVAFGSLAIQLWFYLQVIKSLRELTSTVKKIEEKNSLSKAK